MNDNIKQILDSGRNVFITGEAGSGKTYLTSEYAKTSKRNVAITATTGVASLLAGGETIHRFLKLGISTRPEYADKIIGKWEKVKRSSKPWDKNAWKVMQNLDALVIDEVSMLRRDQFELIDVVLSSIYENPLPFGGLQIILVGDLYQLPPVVSSYDLIKFKDLKKPYCFQSELWNSGKFVTVNLSTNYRQSDPEFLEALNKVRVGNIDAKTNDLFSSRLGADLGGVDPIKIFPLKDNVARENIKSLKDLNKNIFMSEADYKGKDYDVEILKKECPAEDKLYFCEGAQVMMLTNDYEGRWVNGSLGKVLDADPLVIKLYNGNTVRPTLNTWERVEYKANLSGKVEAHTVAEMEQLPIKLAFSSTIHKTQGLTLDYIDVDLNNCFSYGQVYVALSRAKEIKGLRLSGWDKNLVKTDPVVRKFYEKNTTII